MLKQQQYPSPLNRDRQALEFPDIIHGRDQDTQCLPRLLPFMRVLSPTNILSLSPLSAPEQSKGLGICGVSYYLDELDDQMHNLPNGSAGMARDATMTQSSNYGNDAWASISPYNPSPNSGSPMNEYGGFAFTPNALPADLLSRMPPPPTQHQNQHQDQHHQPQQTTPSHMAHQQLPMLNTTWPSQLTNPTASGSYSAPPLSMTPPIGLPAPRDTPRIPSMPSPFEKPKRALSMEQKRAMCQYHEDNPGTRQADIGAKFGVERSTVSKVLRNKDELLKKEQEPPESAMSKRGKAKQADFDRTLSNYIRRQRSQGFDINDDEILEQAKLFAHGSDNQENLAGKLNSAWLRKFKQRHGLGTGRLTRRASETNIPDSARLSTSLRKLKKAKKSIAMSPASPAGQQSPLSGCRSDEDAHPDGLDLEYTYKTAGSQSMSSLLPGLREVEPSSSFSSSALSPTAAFDFSPDPNTGDFMSPGFEWRPGGNSHREKRSYTCPSLDLSYIGHFPQDTTPRNQPSSAAPSSTIESPVSERVVAPFNIDTKLNSPPALRRTSSNSSMSTRPSATPVSAGPMLFSGSTETSPVSPSHEDARRAANTLLSYIKSANSAGQFDQEEFMAVIQLTRKLHLHQHQSSRASIGGLSRIVEGDSELSTAAEFAMHSK